MKYPNLRYGNPNEFAAYIRGIPIKIIAKRLRRSERSVREWLDGRRRMPWWVPEIIRLQEIERAEMLRHMNIQPTRAKLGIASGTVLEFPAFRSATIAPIPKEQQIEETSNSERDSVPALRVR